LQDEVKKDMAQENNNYQNSSEQDSQNRIDSSSSNNGPQFDLEEKEGWLSRYGSSIILPIIAILILAGGIYLYATQKEEETTFSLEEGTADILGEEIINFDEFDEEEESEEIIDLGEETIELKPEIEKESQEEKTIKEIVPEIRKEGNIITVRADKGDGITHLARRALSDYLENRPQERLTDEHKIYIEDYIQNKTGTRSLEVNEEVSFSEGLVQEAIDSSLQLSQNQLKMLEKYSTLVDWES